MTRFASLGLVSVAALGLTLAVPATSQAQTRFGVHVDFGRTHVHVGNGYSYLPSHTHRYDPYQSNYYGQSQYNYGWQSHHHHNYGGYYPQPIVVPQYQHWTPDRGYHSHGQILIPHRNHYHVRPY